jgi:hypothetical protein
MGTCLPLAYGALVAVCVPGYPAELLRLVTALAQSAMRAREPEKAPVARLAAVR